MVNKKIKKIAYLTGTRADFGLMTPVLKAMQKDGAFNLKVFVTGMHLMPRFGLTIKEVKKDFPGAVRVNAVFSSDDKKSVGNFIGALIPKLFKEFSRYKPDIILVLGDRIEMLCTAIVATNLGIPLVHIHGGDKTTTKDDAMRHAITKLSHLHFAATKNSASRIKKMGEDNKRIFVVGAPAIDIIKKARLFTRKQICQKLNLDPKQEFILVTQHPVSEDIKGAEWQMRNILDVVKKFGLPVVVIYPNADSGSDAMIKEIEKEGGNHLFRILKSLPYKNFLSLEKEAAAWVGNSSAGVIESTSFKTPVVNVGKRQFGRPHGENVLDVEYKKKEITRAIKKCLCKRRFIAKAKRAKNPWGEGRAAEKVIKILKRIRINKNFLNK